MRRLLRSKARASMELMGIRKMNKQKWVMDYSSGRATKTSSYFALHWREYAQVTVN